MTIRKHETFALISNGKCIGIFTGIDLYNENLTEMRKSGTKIELLSEKDIILYRLEGLKITNFATGLDA